MEYILLLIVGYFIGFKVSELKNILLDNKINKKLKNELLQIKIDGSVEK